MDDERRKPDHHGDELARRRRAREDRSATVTALGREAAGPCLRERQRAALALREVDRLCDELTGLLTARDPRGAARLSEAVTRAGAAHDRYEQALARWGSGPPGWAEDHDPLTGVLRHHVGVERLLDQVRDCGRQGVPLQLALVDVVPGAQARPVDDEARRQVGTCLLTGLRTGDLSVRHGPDAFVAGMPGADRRTAQDRFTTLALGLRLEDRCAITVTLVEVGDGHRSVTAHGGAPEGRQ